MLRYSHRLLTALVVLGVFCLSLPARAADAPAKDAPAKDTTSKDAPAKKVSAADQGKMVAKGVNYLLTKGRAADGSYSKQAGAAVTALVTTAILKNGRSPDDPQVAKSLKYLEGFVREDGAIQGPDSKIPNYETCVSIICFAAANKDGRYDKTIANAEKFVKGLQFAEEAGKKESDVDYGGSGYGKKGRADLSNTAFLLEALQAAGADANDDAVKKAIIFVSRCQNLESEFNTLPAAAKNPDGGFFYTPAAGGVSAAGEKEKGALRSYGSMTYAGLKSMVFAGVKADDPRVKAATAWLEKNYTLTENPGMGQAGVYYYYHLMAKTLDALGQPTFADSDGKKHEWKSEVASELAARQTEDGSWVNENRQWMEGDANLSTAFALLALSYCQPSK